MLNNQNFTIMKQFRIIVGIIFVVASLLKLATLWGLFHITWLERAAEEPWATYLAPFILILVGADCIYNALKKSKE